MAAMYSVCLTAVCLFVLVATCTAHDDIITDLVQHIERMDAKIAQLEKKHRDEIEELREEIRIRETEYDRKIKDLSERVDNLEEQKSALQEENNEYRVKWQKESTAENANENTSNGNKSGLSKRLGEVIEKGGRMKQISDKRSQPHGSTQSGTAKQRRALLSDLNVAFSAYMDHDADSMGVGQTLIYNQVLLNDGNGYNKHSGIFTVPVGGVYSFSFFVGERDINDEWVALWVNSENKIEAVVQTMHNNQDLQGGNTVNLKVAAGDIVYVKNLGDGHVEGADNPRLTTFSGFLIYPVESVVSVVGK